MGLDFLDTTGNDGFYKFENPMNHPLSITPIVADHRHSQLTEGQTLFKVHFSHADPELPVHPVTHTVNDLPLVLDGREIGYFDNDKKHGNDHETTVS
jgi:hypothetical protein